MRLLTEDVIAIRERLEQLHPRVGELSKPEAKIDVRLTLMNHKRRGDEMAAEQSLYQSEAAAQAWTDATLGFLSEHFARAEVERFMNAGSGTAIGRLAARLAVLGELIDRPGGDARLAGETSP